LESSAAELFSSVQDAGFFCEEVLRATLEEYFVPGVIEADEEPL
jgi:hypothetical protein